MARHPTRVRLEAMQAALRSAPTKSPRWGPGTTGKEVFPRIFFGPGMSIHTIHGDTKQLNPEDYVEVSILGSYT